MKIPAFKNLMSVGALKNPVITSAMLSEKWMLQIDIEERHGREKKIRTEVLESKRGNAREFRSLEAAMNQVKELGFAEAKIRIQ